MAVQRWWSVLWTLLPAVCLACTAYIDDFEVADSADTTFSDNQTSGGSDSTTGTGTGIIGDTAVDTGTQSPVDTTSSGGIESDSGNGESDDDSEIPVVSCQVSIATPAQTAITFCAVPASQTLLGCNDDVSGVVCASDEVPLHSVSLNAFDIMKYEVTQGQFAEFIEANPNWAPDGTLGSISCNTPYLSGWYEGAPLAAVENQPVTEVCFDAAMAYCQWVGANVTLPTEAQFEKAARGNYASPSDPYQLYPFGNNPSCTMANYQMCFRRVLDVGTTVGASPYGVLDLAGNAAEWTRDLYREDYYCNPTDASTTLFTYPNCNSAYEFLNPEGSATGSNYVVKGGSWSTPVGELQISARARQAPRNGTNLLGFRCVRNW